MKTKLEIIEETAAYYCEDPSRRAYNRVNMFAFEPTCQYITLDGRRCAVGRYLLNPREIENKSIFQLVLDGGFNENNFVEEVRVLWNAGLEIEIDKHFIGDIAVTCVKILGPCKHYH